MRVLHVHSGNIFGGVETMMLTMARYQHTCPGLEFEFALCFGGRLRDELTAGGAPVHDLGAVRLRDPLSVRRARRKLDQLVRAEKFDVVLTHSCWTQAAFGPSLRASDVQLVFYLHTPPDGQHWLERLSKRTRPDLVLCNSQFTASFASSLYPNVGSEIVYCPVAPPQPDSQALREARRAELQTSADAVVIIQGGRMERWKGHMLHLEALAKTKASPNWICWIVGGAQRPSERKYFAELKSLARELGISERVRFLGQRDDVNDLLAASDIFCQPNTEGEPFGISFIEAMYAGLPVVTSDIGAAREIVDDTCGFRIPAAKADLLAQALQRLIQNGDERKRLGSGGPVRAKQLCDPTSQLIKFQSGLGKLTHQRQAIA